MIACWRSPGCSQQLQTFFATDGGPDGAALAFMQAAGRPSGVGGQSGTRAGPQLGAEPRSTRKTAAAREELGDMAGAASGRGQATAAGMRPPQNAFVSTVWLNTFAAC